MFCLSKYHSYPHTLSCWPFSSWLIWNAQYGCTFQLPYLSRIFERFTNNPTLTEFNLIQVLNFLCAQCKRKFNSILLHGNKLYVYFTRVYIMFGKPFCLKKLQRIMYFIDNSAQCTQESSNKRKVDKRQTIRRKMNEWTNEVKWAQRTRQIRWKLCGRSTLILMLNKFLRRHHTVPVCLSFDKPHSMQMNVIYRKQSILKIFCSLTLHVYFTTL